MNPCSDPKLRSILCQVSGLSQRRIRGSQGSGLLGKQDIYQKSPGSWELSTYPLLTTENSANLAHYFREWPILRTRNKTSNVRGSISVLNRIFTGEIPH